MPKPGTGQAVISFTPVEASRSFDAAGRLASRPSYAKRELSVFSETGLHPGLSLILGTSVLRNSVQGPPSSQNTGFGYTEIGLKALMGQMAGFSLMAQATARIPGYYGTQTPAVVGNTGMEYDGRLIVAKGFQIAGWNGFVSVSGGYRTRAGQPSDEWRIDATFGVRPVDNIMLLLQSFTVQSATAARGATERASNTKLQASAVFDLSKTLSVQVGAFQSVTGRLSGREKGLLASVWLRY